MDEYIWKDGKRFHICDTCCHKVEMTRDLSDCICGDCGSDNGWNEYLEIIDSDYEMVKQQKIDLVKENIMLKNRIIDLESELEILKHKG